MNNNPSNEILNLRRQVRQLERLSLEYQDDINDLSNKLYNISLEAEEQQDIIIRYQYDINELSHPARPRREVIKYKKRKRNEYDGYSYDRYEYDY